MDNLNTLYTWTTVTSTESKIKIIKLILLWDISYNHYCSVVLEVCEWWRLINGTYSVIWVSKNRRIKRRKAGSDAPMIISVFIRFLIPIGGTYQPLFELSVGVKSSEINNFCKENHTEFISAPQNFKNDGNVQLIHI